MYQVGDIVYYEFMHQSLLQIEEMFESDDEGTTYTCNGYNYDGHMGTQQYSLTYGARKINDPSVWQLAVMKGYYRHS